MTVPVVLAIAGTLAFLIGLFGGGVKIQQIEIPEIPNSGRLISIGAGILLIALSVYLSPLGGTGVSDNSKGAKSEATLSPTPVTASSPPKTPAKEAKTPDPTDIHEGFTYHILNKGYGEVIDVYNDPVNPVHLFTEGEYSGQIWSFSSTPSGYYVLSTDFRGPEFVLEADKNDPHRAFLKPAKRAGRQIWTLIPAGNGCYRIANKEQKDMYLDVDDSEHRYLVMNKISDSETQLWVFKKLRRIADE